MPVWYRYEDVHYAAPADEFGDSLGHGSCEVRLREFEVLRTTPKGVWLSMALGEFRIISEPLERFVLRDARRRFACPTKEEAMESYKARKRAQIRIYKARAARAERALNAAEFVL